MSEANAAKAEAAEGAEKPGEGEAEAEPKPKPKGKLQELLVEYGIIAVIVLLSLSGLAWGGAYLAILAGFEVEGAGAQAGAAAAATAFWLWTKPVRIPVAIALTPVVGAIWHRIRGKEPAKRDATASEDELAD